MPDVTLTERGFAHLAPIPTDYGHVVTVYESSRADQPWLIENHYQFDTAERREVARQPRTLCAHGQDKSSRNCVTWSSVIWTDRSRSSLSSLLPDTSTPTHTHDPEGDRCPACHH